MPGLMRFLLAGLFPVASKVWPELWSEVLPRLQKTLPEVWRRWELLALLGQWRHGVKRCEGPLHFFF